MLALQLIHLVFLLLILLHNDNLCLHAFTIRKKKGGCLRQIVYDDKGFVFLLAWGLPGSTHDDDSVRAVSCALEVRDLLLLQGKPTFPYDISPVDATVNHKYQHMDNDNENDCSDGKNYSDSATDNGSGSASCVGTASISTCANRNIRNPSLHIRSPSPGAGLDPSLHIRSPSPGAGLDPSLHTDLRNAHPSVNCRIGISRGRAYCGIIGVPTVRC